MKKYLLAAAAAGGILVFGGAPAHADVVPSPAGLLDPAGNVSPANGLHLDNPLGGKPLDMKPGTDGVDVQDSNVLPQENGTPAARTGLGGADQRPARPTARTTRPSAPRPAANGGPLGALPVQNLPVQNLPVQNLPVSNLLGGGLPLIGGLMPSGRATTTAAGNAESGLLGGGVPLLGGLGGLQPEDNPTTLPADADDPVASGMPGGGTAVPPATTPGGPATSDPATSDPAPSDPVLTDPPAGDKAPGTAGSGADDRLPEEPIDDEASDGRKFSDGRPVSGPDPDFD